MMEGKITGGPDIGPDIGDAERSDIEKEKEPISDESFPSGGLVCTVEGCGKTFDSKSSVEMHSLSAHKDKDAWRTGGEIGGGKDNLEKTADEGLKPPRIQKQEDAIGFLAARLPGIYGISKENARLCVQRLRERLVNFKVEPELNKFLQG